MKYVITGSVGHISRPVVAALTSAGHTVTVITSSADRVGEIEALGAGAAVGSVTEQQFVTNSFKDADAVYLMVPPNFAVADFPAYQKTVADNYVTAIKDSQVQNVVLLSSIGAHLREGAGPIDGLAYLEEQLQLLQGRNIKVLRPAFFYYNLLGMAGLLKTAGIIGSNFGSNTEKLALAHHLDIADRVTHHLLHPFTGYSIEYVVSDEQYTQDIATILGKAVGKDNAAWVSFPDDQAFAAMTQQGLNASMAGEYVEMGKGFREGGAQADYYAQHKALTGSRNLENFAKDFAQVYNAIPESAALQA